MHLHDRDPIFIKSQNTINFPIKDLIFVILIFSIIINKFTYIEHRISLQINIIKNINGRIKNLLKNSEFIYLSLKERNIFLCNKIFVQLWKAATTDLYVTPPKNRSNRNDTFYLSMWERDICKLARLVSRISRLISSRVGTGPTRAK